MTMTIDRDLASVQLDIAERRDLLARAVQDQLDRREALTQRQMAEYDEAQARITELRRRIVELTERQAALRAAMGRARANYTSDPTPDQLADDRQRRDELGEIRDELEASESELEARNEALSALQDRHDHALKSATLRTGSIVKALACKAAIELFEQDAWPRLALVMEFLLETGATLNQVIDVGVETQPATALNNAISERMLQQSQQLGLRVQARGGLGLQPLGESFASWRNDALVDEVLGVEDGE